VENSIKSYLKDLLIFDEETGVFTWIGGKKYYPKSGKQAGIITVSGYRKIRVGGMAGRHVGAVFGDVAANGVTATFGYSAHG